jgi:hypothetical protein
MARKPTDYVLLKVRMRLALKRKLERAAEKKGVSANSEAVERIERTLEEEERHEAWFKEMKEREAEVEEEARRFFEERAKEDARIESALRDTKILNMMIENKYPGALLLRVFAREIAERQDWSATPESKKAFADRMHWIITNNDFAGDFL